MEDFGNKHVQKMTVMQQKQIKTVDLFDAGIKDGGKGFNLCHYFSKLVFNLSAFIACYSALIDSFSSVSSTQRHLVLLL